MTPRRLGPIEAAVKRDAREAGILEKHKAGVLAAKTLARALDDHPGVWEVVDKIAPKLVVALTALGLTETAKSNTKGGVVPNVSTAEIKDDLAELRAKHSRNA